MNMELGPEVKRQIILKLRTKLKGLLAENEILAGDKEHMLLLYQLIEIIDDTNAKYRANDLLHKN
jgi:hypothetical protein